MNAFPARENRTLRRDPPANAHVPRRHVAADIQLGPGPRRAVPELQHRPHVQEVGDADAVEYATACCGGCRGGGVQAADEAGGRAGYEGATTVMKLMELLFLLGKSREGVVGA